MQYPRDPDQLEIYSELKKSKNLVGKLKYEQKSKKYILEYDRKYLLSKSSIPIGPELPLSKAVHVSKAGELFPSLLDRIPSRQNAAYEEYCLAQDVSPKEKNPIILLSTIGRRGPSTFVFEPVYHEPELVQRLKHFRKELNLSLREISAAFDLNFLTLHKIENGKSRDKTTIKLLTIYLTFPKVALWQIELNQRKLHKDLLARLTQFFSSKTSKDQINLFED